MSDEGKSDGEPYWSWTLADAMRAVNSSMSGLSSGEAERRLRAMPRAIGDRRVRSGMLMARQFRSPIIVLLVVSAVLSLMLGEEADSVIILGIVMLSGILGFIQERGAVRAIDALLASVRVHADVLRDGVECEMTVGEVVPGDVVRLRAGDVVPGDGLVIEANQLLVDESSLTGEAYPRSKEPGPMGSSTELHARSNCIHLGTHVASGEGSALIVRTGIDTEFGKVAEHVARAHVPTSFERGATSFGLLLMKATAALVAAVFVFNILLERPLVDSLLFSLALAVGLTPQMLPAIITLSLSKGAAVMAGKRVIVKRLDAIEDIGSLNVLCTDKTGTITVGTVEVSDAERVGGEHSDRVLRLAALNAAFQTGFTNPIDRAILAAAGGIPEGAERRGEIPFDFQRRRLSVWVSDDGASILVTKGAVVPVIECCTSAVVDEHRVVPIAAAVEDIRARFEALSARGLRVLAVASRPIDSDHRLGPESETELRFEGFLALVDPPKPGVRIALERLAALGVSTRMITGDNRHAAAYVASAVGLGDGTMLLGSDIESMSDEHLAQVVGAVTVFAETGPLEKERIVRAFTSAGATVGYLGDGINDAPPLRVADVGISVDTAVDVAKQTADLVLLDKDLLVLGEGIAEGRRVFANTLKYVHVTTGANFGNMVSLALAAVLLPFLPMQPMQILILNFLSDIPGMTIATDKVDPEQMASPVTWDIRRVRNFMVVFGLASTAFDLMTFLMMRRWFGADAEMTRTGWFIESTLTELMAMLMLRTHRFFLRSAPSFPLLASSAAVATATVALPWLPWAGRIGLEPIGPDVLAGISVLILGYVAVTETLKQRMKSLLASFD